VDDDFVVEDDYFFKMQRARADSIIGIAGHVIAD
jgi:hypothetical protein